MSRVKFALKIWWAKVKEIAYFTLIVLVYFFVILPVEFIREMKWRK